MAWLLHWPCCPLGAAWRSSSQPGRASAWTLLSQTLWLRGRMLATRAVRQTGWWSAITPTHSPRRLSSPSWSETRPSWSPAADSCLEAGWRVDFVASCPLADLNLSLCRRQPFQPKIEFTAAKPLMSESTVSGPGLVATSSCPESCQADS